LVVTEQRSMQPPRVGRRASPWHARGTTQPRILIAAVRSSQATSKHCRAPTPICRISSNCPRCSARRHVCSRCRDAQERQSLLPVDICMGVATSTGVAKNFDAIVYRSRNWIAHTRQRAVLHTGPSPGICVGGGMFRGSIHDTCFTTASTPEGLSAASAAPE
jgi:hypothetical protein